MVMPNFTGQEVHPKRTWRKTQKLLVMNTNDHHAVILWKPFILQINISTNTKQKHRLP
jgi:hypothetical protein